MTPPSVPLLRVDSPCIKVCTLDAQNVCVGCGRTIDEIAGWAGMSVEQQLAVCERAAQRRESSSTSRS
jgi:uncharacterized protein